ncbi:MAG: hypothetical protein ACFBZ8_12420 [Opitutales bacterium]
MNITIKGLPDAVHQRLKERAKRNQRSLSQEVIRMLSQASQVRRRTQEEEQALLARIDASIERH